MSGENTHSESREDRLKRLTMRSNRRGIKEMDIILGRFAQRALAGLSAAELDQYELLLGENDNDLYQWVTEQKPTPERLVELMDQVREIGAKF
ncbi:MAG: succinate dehydrogenase assembly factor 2 [Rhodobacterales bacterium]|nr:MAG: succinate dehydrogenase assembly factor 2 [Rhodobacterales bacterium]